MDFSPEDHAPSGTVPLSTLSIPSMEVENQRRPSISPVSPQVTGESQALPGRSYAATAFYKNLAALRQACVFPSSFSSSRWTVSTPSASHFFLSFSPVQGFVSSAWASSSSTQSLPVFPSPQYIAYLPLGLFFSACGNLFRVSYPFLLCIYILYTQFWCQESIHTK